MRNVFYSDGGITIHLDREIDRGGQGAIYLIHGYPSEVAKIYIKQQSHEVCRKLLAMVRNPPHDPTINGPTKHPSIAWPSGILYKDIQKTQFAGFMMPKINMKVFRKILNYLLPDDRVKAFGGGFTWYHLYTTARNLASCIAAIHERGYCVGDINESNILVQSSTPLTIIDCDSFQVKDSVSGKIWRCTVGKPEYTAPEILGNNHEDFDRTEKTDCFALAVMIFQLLMEGFHPYAATGSLVDNAANTSDKIKLGFFPYGISKRGIYPPPSAPSFDILHPEIKALFLRCFDVGHKDPSHRPTAKEWMAVLEKLRRGNFRKCSINENHHYLDHLHCCPWCERTKKEGKDSFLSPIGQQIHIIDQNNRVLSEQEREEILLPFIEMALMDEYLSPAEEASIMDRGLKLRLSEKDVRKLIAIEIQKKGSQVKNSAGTPKLEISGISNTDFPKIRVGSSASGTFTINNVGGGVLSGPIKTTTKSGKKWLRVDQGSIDTSRHKQDPTTFHIDTSGLTFGFEDEGYIEIQSSAGTKTIKVNISIEEDNAAIDRFRKALTIGGLICGGLFGFFIYNLTFIQGIGVNVANLAAIVALLGIVIIGGKQGFKDGVGASFGCGCGALIAGVIVLVISEHFRYTHSTVAWALVYGSLGNHLAPLIRRALWRGDKNIPIAAGIGAVLLAALVIFIGFVATEKETEAKLARQNAAEALIKDITDKLPGKWQGKIGNKKALFSITQKSAQLSAKMIYDGVDEKLSPEIRGDGLIVLKGTGYQRISGQGSFSLDTFYGRLSNDGHSITGDYEDDAGRKGKWSASKVSGHISEAFSQELYKTAEQLEREKRERNRAFIEAAMKGETETVKSLLEKGVDMNTQDYNDRTALMIAARDGNIDMVKALLEKGADVNFKNHWNDTALSWAQKSKHEEIVHILESPAATSYPRPESIFQSTSKSFSVGILSSPPSATVFIDKKMRGSTPLSIDLKEGSYGIRIEKEGYKTFRDIIDVVKHSKKEFNFTLEKE